jgi:hypothetical protein
MVTRDKLGAKAKAGGRGGVEYSSSSNCSCCGHLVAIRQHLLFIGCMEYMGELGELGELVKLMVRGPLFERRFIGQGHFMELSCLSVCLGWLSLNTSHIGNS